jgi:outer membrane protein assembly factor BamB
VHRRRLLRASALAASAALGGCGTGLLGSPTATGTAAPPAVRWRKPLDVDPARGAVAVGEEYVYYVAGSRLHALTRDDGHDIGDVDVPYGDWVNVTAGDDVVIVATNRRVAGYDPVPRSDPRWTLDDVGGTVAVHDDGLVVERDDALVVVSTTDGSVVWRDPKGDGRAAVVDWTADTVLVAGLVDGTVTLRAVDRSDGSLRWRRALPDGASWLAPTLLDGGTVYWGIDQGRQGRFLALDATDGRLLWDRDLEGGIVAPMSVVDDVVVVDAGFRPDRLVGFGTGSGGRRWSRSERRGLAFADDWLLAGAGGGSVEALEADGTSRWSFDAAAGAAPTPTADGGDPRLLATLASGVVVKYGANVYGLAPADGLERWRYEHPRRVERWWPAAGEAVLWDGEALVRVAFQ